MARTMAGRDRRLGEDGAEDETAAGMKQTGWRAMSCGVGEGRRDLGQGGAMNFESGVGQEGPPALGGRLAGAHRRAGGLA
jgi:hypothetical protein